MGTVPLDAPSFTVTPEGCDVPSWRIRYVFRDTHWADFAMDSFTGSGDEDSVRDADGNEWDVDEITGFLKWDGCMQWSTNPGCMAHTCGRGGVREFAEALMAVQEQVGPKMEGWARGGAQA